MNPKPIGIRILVKRLEEESRIWLPPSSIRTVRGAVVEIGEDVHYIEVADEVLFDQDKAAEFRLEGETFFVMPEGSVLVVLDRVEAHSL